MQHYPQRTYMPIKTLLIDGKPVKCFIDGDGPIPCLFIGPGAIYFPTIASEAKRELFTFYSADRYFTKPSNEAEELNPEDITSLDLNSYISYYEKVRKALKLGQVALMGPSALGLVAHEYAQQHTSKITHVFMIGTPSTTRDLVQVQNTFFEGNYNPNYYPSLATTWSKKKWINFHNDRQTFQQINLNLTDEECYIKELVADQEKYSINPESEIMLKNRWDSFNLTMRKHFFEKMIAGYIMQGKVKVPTLVVSGLYDGIAPFYDIADKIGKKIIYGKISQVILEDAAHSPHFESIQFTECIMKWLSQTSCSLQARL